MENEVSYDIKNTKEVLVLAFSIGGAFKAANADGKIGYEDIGQLMTVIPSFGSAFEDIAKVPAELKDMSAEEAQELRMMITEKFGALVDEAKLVEQVNLGLEAMVCLYKFVMSLKKD